MDGVRHFVGDCDIWRGYENSQSKAAAEMDGRAVSGYGVDAAVYSAGDAASYFCARDVVYSGGRTVLFAGGDILSVAADEVLACDMAFVRNRGQRVFLLCGAVRVHY